MASGVVARAENAAFLVGAPHGRELFVTQSKKQKLAPMGRSYGDDNLFR